MKVSIEYCTSWGYLNQALSLRESIERQFGVKAELVKGMGGVFEVSVNELLKENGHAYEYHGEKKKVFGS